MGQLVHQDQGRLACQRRVEIKGAQRRAAIGHGTPWQHLQSCEQGFSLGPTVGIDPAHDDVDALLASSVSRLEHGVGFAYASRGTEENLEFTAALMRLFFLYAGPQGIGIGPVVMHTYPYGYFFTSSRARFKARTFTRGSPNSPRVRPSVCWATIWRTVSSLSPRARATRPT